MQSFIDKLTGVWEAEYFTNNGLPRFGYTLWVDSETRNELIKEAESRNISVIELIAEKVLLELLHEGFHNRKRGENSGNPQNDTEV